MQVELSKRAIKDFEQLDEKLKDLTEKQFNFLTKNFRHNSLNIKKYDKTLNLWQGRINKSWRFYFHIIDNIYYIIKIKNHPK